MKIKKKDIIRLLNSLIEKVLTYKIIDFTYNISTPVREKPSEGGMFTDLEHTNDYIVDLHIHLFRKRK